VKLSSIVEFEEILEQYRIWRRQFLDETGRLKPNYRPPPLEASFMREPSAAGQRDIPVPKGPVEVW
jgi:hypothetical protein